MNKFSGRYYYWQMDTDMVSWLPPKHPKCVTSEPAAKLREKVLQSNYSIVNIKNNTVKDDKRKLLKGKDKEKEEKRSGKFEEKDRPARKKIRKDGPLDPMDPAAYSDIPQVRRHTNEIEAYGIQFFVKESEVLFRKLFTLLRFLRAEFGNNSNSVKGFCNNTVAIRLEKFPVLFFKGYR